jgi:hypothetical protein
MLSYAQSAAVIVFSICTVLGILHYFDRKLEEDTRKRSNGVNGWQLSILGAIYAVALGFMLSDAWIAYQTAGADVRNEAAAALTVYRLSKILPAPCSTQMSDLSRDYVRGVLDVEWPGMAVDAPKWPGDEVVREMWSTLNSCQLSGGELSDRPVLIDALETLQARRDSRMEDFSGHLPFLMWAVLLFGGAAVVTSSCLLGNEKRSVHRLHVVSLTVLVATMLLTISDLDRPFTGATHVGADAFNSALTSIGRSTK